MSFPQQRLRRLRRSQTIRRMVRQTRLTADDFVYPLFVQPGTGVRAEIASMPGICRLSVDQLVDECAGVAALGIPAVLLFGIPDYKDERGSAGLDDDGIVQTAVRAITDAGLPLQVITDVCLCEYTSHGHCGVVVDGVVDNDATLELLQQMAVSHVRAGADMVAPSDMMDGRVGAIRQALDTAGFAMTPIMSYAAKFASAFYGPFRDAADSAPQFGDRRSYQMDPANADEALRETALDVEEGADIVMVKPALAYLDLVWRIKQRFGMPVAAYQVSGEYSMLRAAARAGWIDGSAAMLESLTAIKRAGADIIITYFARDAARLLQQER